MSSRDMQLTRLQSATLAAAAAALVLAGAAPADAANYPLQLMHPRAAGTSSEPEGPPISQNHRIFWAYPGLEYNIRAAVIGGAYPYVYALSNAPPGMTIDAATGTIAWAAPATATAVTPTLTVTDQEGTAVSASWTIRVDASRFLFVDAVNGREFDASPPGTGTIDKPFRRLRDIYSGNAPAAKVINTHAHKLVYFRRGTYQIDGYLEDVGAYDGFSLGRMPMSDSVKPVAWLAYPGEIPTIDGQCAAASRPTGARGCSRGPHIAFYGTAHNVYWDGLHVVNVAVHGVRTEGVGNYQVFRRGTWRVQGPTVRSANAGMVTFAASGGAGSPMGWFTAIQDNDFSDIDGGMCVELYSVQRTLIENNTCHNVYSSNGFADDGGVFIKGGEMRRITVRGNTFHNMARRAIAGNMLVLRSAEILFNRVYDIKNVNNYTEPGNYNPVALEVNQNGEAGVVHIYRNTLIGRVIIYNTDAADGPFYLQHNVIVNNDSGSHVAFENVTAASRIVLTENLVGKPEDKLVDATGNLTGSFRSYVGRRGDQREGNPAPPPRNKPGIDRRYAAFTPRLNRVAHPSLAHSPGIGTDERPCGALACSTDVNCGVRCPAARERSPT
jgi:hypothetical protein